MQLSPYLYPGLQDTPDLTERTEKEHIDYVVRTCSDYSGIPIKDLLFKRCQNSIVDRPISNMKKLICYYLRTRGVPIKAVERCYPDNKGFNHATVSHNYDEVRGFLHIKDPEFTKFVNDLNDIL
jgi:hypothetical protein